MISAWTENNDRARARVMAVRHTLSESDLNASDLKLIETDYGIETGAVAFEQIIQRLCPQLL
jgi:LacI family transcriptional regulator